MDKKENYQKLRDLVLGEGITLLGVADIRKIRNDFLLPKEGVEKLDFAISIGFWLSQSVLNTLIDRPNKLYFFHYQRVNVLLDTVALKVSGFLQKEGYSALPIPASQIVEYNATGGKGHLSHKKIAYLAGLGWRGRNGLLVNPQYGSHVRYATVLTAYPLTADQPLNGSCGECKNCIPICPAQAIGENEFNLLACYQKLKEFTKTEKISQHICGICIKICPGKNV